MTQETRSATVLALHDCYRVCLASFAVHCTKAGGNHMAREHIRRMLSCIDLCALTADFLLRHSPQTQDLCLLCADICKQCATSCEALENAEMQQCAEICTQAAHACLAEHHHLKVLVA
jgi:hypothetical protein